MTVVERLAKSIVVPVVVLDKAEDAIPTAKAMLAGGVDTMEITFRTACAPEAIKAVAENCPDVLVGAGTIINVEQAKLAVQMGAKFIVSPGFSDEIVGYLYYHWCYSGYPYTVANQSGNYNRFHAYYSTKTPSEANSYDSSDSSYRFDDATACPDSVWYFAVPVRPELHRLQEPVHLRSLGHSLPVDHGENGRLRHPQDRDPHRLPLCDR